MKTAPPPADIAARISEITNEIARIEGAGPSLSERLAAAESELARAEAHFRKFGFNTVGSVPSERAHYRELGNRGALMVAAGEAIRAAERQRVEAAYRASGAVEFDAARLEELRASLRPLLALREQGWRAEEAAGRGADRSQFDPEFFLMGDADLLAIAGAKEATA